MKNHSKNGKFKQIAGRIYSAVQNYRLNSKSASDARAKIDDLTEAKSNEEKVMGMSCKFFVTDENDNLKQTAGRIHSAVQNYWLNSKAKTDVCVEIDSLIEAKSNEEKFRFCYPGLSYKDFVKDEIIYEIKSNRGWFGAESSIHTHMANLVPQIKECPEEKIGELIKQSDIDGAIEKLLSKKIVVCWLRHYERCCKDLDQKLANKRKCLRKNKKLFKKHPEDLAEVLKLYPEISFEINYFMNQFINKKRNCRY